MGLTYRKEEQLRSMPHVQSRIKTSRNGRYIIQQTIITNIKPIGYYHAILANATRTTNEPLGDDEIYLEEDIMFEKDN